MGRTVYVANVNSQLTLDNIREFFSVCGPVSLTKLAGEADGTRLTRFAFVEFVSSDSVPGVSLLIVLHSCHCTATAPPPLHGCPARCA